MEKARGPLSKRRKKPTKAEKLLMIPMTVEMGGYFFPGIMVADGTPAKESFGIGKVGKPFTRKDGALRDAKDDIASALRHGQRLGDKAEVPAYLVRRGYIPVEPPRKSRKRGSPSDEELFSRTCAWCAGIVSDHQRVYGTGVNIGDKVRKGLKPFYGTRILFPMTVLGRSLPVAIAEPGSDTHRRGHDILFMTCSSNCSTQLKRALEREKETLDSAVFV
jgi:hypothetical protein